MIKENIDKMKAAEILEISFPEYFQDVECSLEQVMNLILTVHGIIPFDKKEEFITSLGLSGKDLKKVQNLPINFDVYNKSVRWKSVDSDESYYAFKKVVDGNWKKEMHLQLVPNDGNKNQTFVRILYFEEP